MDCGYLIQGEGAAIESEAAPNLCPNAACGVANPATARVCQRCSSPLPMPVGTLLQGRYRITPNWSVEGNWTHELKNDGNYEGEAGQTISPSGVGDYPEILHASRNFPSGHLDEFQKDLLRAWTIYNWDIGRVYCVTYAPDGLRLAAGGDLGRVVVWDAE